jgi:dipeptidase E
MGTLLLTSTGLTSAKLKTRFTSLFTKPLGEIMVVLIPTAARNEEELGYVSGSKQELLALGIKGPNITVYDCDYPKEIKQLTPPDCVYVCGGNTFYLLQRIKESKSDQIIIDWVNGKTIYIGVSAGSIIAGPDVSIAGPWDPNDIELKDLSGLKLTDTIISPHYVPAEEAQIQKIEKQLDRQVLRLKDDTGLLIDKDNPNGKLY